MKPLLSALPVLFLAFLGLCSAAVAQNPVFVLNPVGHSGRIQGIRVTPDQKTIVTFGMDKSICLWDVATGQLLRKKWLDTGPGDMGKFIDVDMGPRTGVIVIARINAEGKPVVNLIDILADRVIGTFEGFSHDLGFVRIDPAERFIVTGTWGTGNIYSEPTRLWKIPRPPVTPFSINKSTAQAEGTYMHDVTFYNEGNDLVIHALRGDHISFHVTHDPAAIPEYTLRKQPMPLKDPGHLSYSSWSNQAFSVTHEGQATLFNKEKSVTIIPQRKHWSTKKGDSATQQVDVNRSATFAIATGTLQDMPGDFMEVYDLKNRKRILLLSGWYQSVVFVSDTSIATECHNGFRIYNIITGKSRMLQSPRSGVSDRIQYGTGSQVMFDSLQRVFDFEKLELHEPHHAGANQQGFSSAKMTYHNQRIGIPAESEYGLHVNGRFTSFFPHGMSVSGLSFINDGRVVTGRTGYRSFSHYLLMYDLALPAEKGVYEPLSVFDGTFGTVCSVVPHPDLESSLFAVRDRIGAIALFDGAGPSTTVFKNMLRYWPFVKLNLDVTKKGDDVLASPQPGYSGTLVRGDKLQSINGFRPGNKDAIIRFLDTLDPLAPVDLEVTRGTQQIHSIEKLNALAMRSPLLSFIPLENDEWLCWTPQGYYAASANGERLGGWVINKGVNAFAEFHPIYDFKKQFYKPELIKMIAKQGSIEKAVQEYNATSAQPLSLSIGLSSKLPPSITWINPSRDTSVNKSTVRFVALVQSSSKLQSAKILLNGRTILRRDQISIRQDRDSPAYTISFELDLLATNNVVNVFVENEYGTTISIDRALRMNSSETGIEKYKPNLYLLSVGVSQHTTPAYSLTYADKDAKSIEELYRSQQGLLFKNVFVRTLVNEQATRTGILEAFYWLEQNATQKDVVVIFMASHGLNDKDKFYILPYDGDPDRIRITGVDWSNFADVLGNLPSKVLVFVDACHSGKLGANILAKRGDTDLMEAIRSLATEENGVVIMAASTGKESSLESAEWEHGAFTKALLEGLGEGKADINGDNIINIREIDYYVADRVKALTNGRQHPTTQKPSVVSEFPLVMKKM